MTKPAETQISLHIPLIRSDSRFQNIRKKNLSSSFSGKKSHFWHYSGAVATISQPTKILLSRYTAGFISDDLLEDFENALPYLCTFLANRMYAIENLLADFNVQPRIELV